MGCPSRHGPITRAVGKPPGGGGASPAAPVASRFSKVPIDNAPLDASALDLTGKVAVVTGAARGLGAGVALALGRCGAQLAICDRGDMSDTVSGLATPPVVSTMDVRDATAVASFAETVGDRFGGIDILVNHAGCVLHSSFYD